MALHERSRGFTIASSLAHRATTDPGAAFLHHGEDVSSYGEVDSQAEALAAALAQLGVESGDRIALVLPPCPEFAIALFAAAKLGAVVVPLNPRLTPPELQYMLRHSETVCAVTIEREGQTDYLQLFEELMPQLPELQYLVTVGEEDLWYDDRIFQFEDLLSAGGGRDYPAPESVESEDCFAIVYTSGTMGKPKGVELSHENLVSVAAGVAETFGLQPEDRIVGVTALYHMFGLGSGLLAALESGASLILQDRSDAEATLDAAERHGATVHYGIPTLFVRELRILDARPLALPGMRLAVVAGAPVHDELVDRIAAAFDATVLTAYSVTETASTLCATRPDDPEEKRRFTVGRPLAGAEVRIASPEGELLPVESVGEIGVRGPCVMMGYYRQPGETRSAFDADGYFLTGDLGLLDEDGYLHLVGRTKDVIIRSGFNVYPREVETRIGSHPAVQEVAVIGIPDPLLGEAICACIVPVEGAIVTGPEIVDWCRETLAEDKVPDSVQFLDALPRTDTGKVRRVDLSRSLESESQTT
jgi:fatty-acyl-CoA synthase